MTVIVDGKQLALSMRSEQVARVAQLTSLGKRPGLAVILIGADPASQVYVRNKVKACVAIGVHSELYQYPGDVDSALVEEKIHALNSNPAIHGILVQLPLPKHLDTQKILALVDSRKDVDGFHAIHLGHLVKNAPCLAPCTPAGVMRLLDHAKTELWGANAVVIGSSITVGKPAALMLMHRGATVTVCNSKTRNLADHTQRADVVIAAVGRAHMVTADMIKPGATVIDVGINRLADGRLVGDVDYASVAPLARAITPVPGGVGPMTIAMLLENTLQAATQ